MSPSFNDEYKSSWKAHSTQEKKPWGYEIKVGSLRPVAAKILCIEAGKNTSLKYYSQKNEVLFLRRGKIRVIHGDEHTLKNEKLYPYKSTTLLPGEALNIQSGCPYQLFAEEDSEIFELGDSPEFPNKISTVTKNESLGE